MVNESDRLDAVFGALSDPTRRAIVRRLAAGEASVSALAEPFDVTLPAITKHLAVLERVGLLAHRKDGRTRYCRLEPAPLREVDEWLESYRGFWQQRLRGLSEHFKSKERR